MRPLAPSMRIAFTDLVDSVHDTWPAGAFPLQGAFYKQKRGQKEYWYHVMRDRAAPSGRRSVYVGVVGDSDVEALIKSHGHEHERYKLQKETASLLRRAGLPAPDPMTGQLTQVFQKADLFRSGAVLFGAAAYKSYGGILGFKLSGIDRTPGAEGIETVNVASGARLSELEGFEKILKLIDASFASITDEEHSTAGLTRFETASGFKVNHYSSLRLDQELSAQIDPIDFLIKNPVRSALLHREGVAVLVPEPARHALYDLAFGRMPRLGREGKATQYRIVELIKAIELAGRTSEIAEAWSDLWCDKHRRGDVAEGVLGLPRDALDILAQSAIRYGAAPFSDNEPPTETLGIYGRQRSSKLL